MKNAIIIHGIDETREDFLETPNGPSNFHWFPWGQWEMVKMGILAQTPEMPNPYLADMNYDDWTGVFEQFDVNKDTILIGHSCGGGYLLKYLSLNPNVCAGHLILIAPWIDVEGKHPTFFKDFELDSDFLNRVGRIDLFYSTDDDDYIIKSVDKIKSVYGDKIIYHEFSDKGHFCMDDIGSTFPEVLEIIKSEL